MARLPDSSVLGGPSFSGGRPIARVDNSGYVEGARDLARGVANLGIGIREHEEARERAEVARAKSKFLIGKIELDQQFGRESRYQGLKDDYSKKLRELADNTLSSIPGERGRSAFRQEVDVIAAKGLADMDEKQWSNERDALLAETSTDLDSLRNAGLNSADPVMRASVVQTARDRINSLAERGFISQQEAAKKNREWAESYATASVEAMPLEERLTLLRKAPANTGSMLDRIRQAESSGNPNAQPIDPETGLPASSALGAYQFTKGTWLQMVREHRPELLKSLSENEVLELRRDPNLSREMAEHLLAENSAALNNAGLPVTPATQYLAHFLGAGDAIKVLKADPGTPLKGLVSDDSIKANASVLKGRTAGSLTKWAADKMGSEPQTGTVVDFLPADKRFELLDSAEREQAQIDKDNLTFEKNAATLRRQELERDGYDLMLNDELTPEWLAEHREEIGVSTYKTLAKSLSKESRSQTDEALHIHLLELVDTDPEQAVEEAKEAYREDRIARDVFQSILSKSKQETRRDRAWEKDVRGFVRRSLDFGQAASQRQKERQVNALFAFDDWLAKNPQSSREEAMKEAKEMVADFRRGRSAETRATAPMPQDVAATRDTMTMDDIAAAKTAIIAKLKAGQITREDAIREAAILQRWQKALQDAEDDPLRLSKPFRTPEAPRPPMIQQQAPQTPETAPQRPERQQAPQGQQGNVFAPGGLLNRFDPITGQYLGR